MSHIEKRTRVLRKGTTKGEAPLYWMIRDKRAVNNWALIAAQDHAIKHKMPLIVCFQYIGNFLDANIRQYKFLFDGLEETLQTLRDHNIPLFILQGRAELSIPELINTYNIGAIFTDFSPLNVYERRINNVLSKTNLPFYQIDAHNIVPVWEASDKQEYAAYTFRPKLLNKLKEFLVDYPKLKKHPFEIKDKTKKINFSSIYKRLNIDYTIKELDWIKPGESAAQVMLELFINNKLEEYDEKRNDPNYQQLSNLSPYIHYGQISAQHIALKLELADNTDSFLEQCIIRRELSDNFCYYNKQYDDFNGFPEWAKSSLNDHRKDIREYIYSKEEFENSATHDHLWNAAQNEMRIKGKMHGYMRMYWAKKILEWSSEPEEALQIAIDLNDKYSIDGRDPNGYTGIAWSIGGVHDRPWFERPIFGKIRYMNYNGCKRKFNINNYTKLYSNRS